MKILLLSIFITVTYLNFAPAQDAKSILQQSQQKVNEIKTCSYLLYGATKVTGKRDTIYQTGRCTFVKNDNDTFLGRHIYIDNFSGVKEVYDGNIYFKSRTTDSTVYIWDVHRFNFFKHQFATNSIAYSPLLNKKNIYSQLLNDTESTLSLSTDTLIGESLCYHIKTFTQKLRDNKETGITIAADLFIRQSDFMPVGHVQNLQSNIAKAINNYESVFLEELEINKPVDENIFSINNVPVHYTRKQQGIVNIKNYIIDKEQIPDLDYNWIKSDSVYKSIKDKYVLATVIAPGYCLPCEQAMKMLEDIWKKSNGKNLSVIIVPANGLNEKNNAQNKFPSLNNGKLIIDKTAINVFPTIYLFNEQGVQVYKSEGFNNRMQEEIMNEIK